MSCFGLILKCSDFEGLDDMQDEYIVDIDVSLLFLTCIRVYFEFVVFVYVCMHVW